MQDNGDDVFSYLAIAWSRLCMALPSDRLPPKQVFIGSFMQTITADQDRATFHPFTHAGRWRLTIGILQGLVLYVLYEAAARFFWPATNALVFAPALLVFTLIPVMGISALANMPLATLWRWLLVATVILAGLGVYDVWRNIGAPPAGWYGRSDKVQHPSVLLWLFGAAGLFIAHTLVLAAAADQKRIADYPTYFDCAWKLLVQLKFSGLFVTAVWMVLWLGAWLFDLIQLSFLKDLLGKTWFSIPATVFAFACAVHLTDVRPAIVRGIRNLLLVLLSWVLPVTLLIVGGFLLSLPFTGLGHLWATKHATALLLSAAAILVVLINTAFQNGAVALEVPRILRIFAQLACLMLLPLVTIAAYALWLRVADYGWTTDRIIAACCIVVAGCYALGYTWSAVQRTGLLNRIAPVNITTTLVILVILLSLFSPVLDPARISVAHQMARLENGLQSAANFDFEYLKFEGKRFGTAALEQLKTTYQGVDSALVREKAALAQAKKTKWDQAERLPTAVDVRANLTIWPKGKTVPGSFVSQDWKTNPPTLTIPSCLRTKSICDAYLIDLDGDGQTEILLIGRDRGDTGVFAQAADGNWRLVAKLPDLPGKCPQLQNKLQANEYKLVAPRLNDLEIAGQRIPLLPETNMQSMCVQPASWK
jgi:Domain of unknown function (DUF4153)